jgi:hypothetical protein
MQILVSSAKKGFPEACYTLATEHEFPYQEIAPERDEAMLMLLKKAYPTVPEASGDLGRLYLESDTVKNLLEARKYLKIHAYSRNDLNWDIYASMCEKGEGGKVDLEEAYFFYSALSYIAHPRSLAGEGAWKDRERVRELLGVAAGKVLERLDVWNERGYKTYYFPDSSSSMEKEHEVYEVVQKLEKEYRKKHGLPLKKEE